MPVQVQAYTSARAHGVAAVSSELGWPSFSDPAVADRACTAPGVVAFVALDEQRVVGFAQAVGDGQVQSFLAQLGVVPAFRRRGIARRLVVAAFAATGTQRMDLITDDAQAFYRSFAHRERTGFRIYPQPSLATDPV